MFTTAGTRLKVKADDIKSKAGTLKGTAGTQSTSELTNARDNDIQGASKGNGLTSKAEALKEKAGVLHDAADGIVKASGNELDTLKDTVVQLRDAAKKTDPGSGDEGLYKAANDLATQTQGLENLANNVIQKFDEVKGHYEALMAQANDEQKKDPLVTDVETKYKALKDIYNEILNLTKLKNKANTLNSSVEGPSTTELTEDKLRVPAQTLATKADTLYGAANAVVDSTLRTQATALKNAAKKTGSGDDNESLHKKATELQTSTDYANARPVIEAFDTVKTLYDALIKQAIERSKLELVRNVISKFEDLKNHYDTMIPFTKIRYYSQEISTKAGNLRSTGGQDEADKIVRYFESMKYAYNQLTETEQTRVKTQFEALKDVYDPILNVTKMKHYATQVEAKAPQIGTSATPSDVKTLIDILKNIYSSITDQGGKNSVKQDWNDLKNVIDGAMKRWKFFWIIIPSIATQWLNFLTHVILLIVYVMGKIMEQVYNKTQNTTKPHASNLKASASGMLIDAGTLHGNANSLEGAALGSSATDAEALKQKAGTSQETAGTLRYLAKELYKAANALDTAVGSGKPGYTEANNLATAVGSDELTGSTLRAALKALGDDQGADTSELPTKAKAVRDAYDGGGNGVKQKFDAVKLQESTYKDAGHETLYEEVDKAWDAFNTLYETDLKQLARDLNNAIGTSGQPIKLQKTLADLGDLTGDSDLNGKASNVKTAYDSGSGDGVKPKFDKLQAQQTFYKAISSIRSLYNLVVTAMTSFDSVYNPEELFMKVVGATDQAPGPGGKPKNLREALVQLGSASEGDVNLPDFVKSVKTQYGDNWSGVKAAFNNVKAQADAYKKGNTIKTSQYTQLVGAWNNFNNKYHDAIST